MICFFKGHKFEHIANFIDVDRIGLWQCTRCKLVRMDMSSEYYDKRKYKAPQGK